VATPIGNLADLSERALKVLSEVDFVAAEDTRNSGLLLSRFDISKPMISYFEHNKRERGEIIAEKLLAGESCALITDAGTPAISDPGEDIVRLCAERGIPVTSIPGACAAVTALTLSGLATGRFAFEGFISTAKNERRDRLSSLSSEERTMIFYEAPHRLKSTLSDFAAAFGKERKITLCRELTKLNEEVMRTTIGEAMAYYEERAPKGEYVLVVEGCPDGSKAKADYPEDIAEHVELLISEGMSKMDAIKACAKARGVAKSVIYNEINND
jgi:16S rRNA (cytidine1402-2'-O)-methyltransferase